MLWVPSWVPHSPQPRGWVWLGRAEPGRCWSQRPSHSCPHGYSEPPHNYWRTNTALTMQKLSAHAPLKHCDAQWMTGTGDSPKVKTPVVRGSRRKFQPILLRRSQPKLSKTTQAQMSKSLHCCSLGTSASQVAGCILASTVSIVNFMQRFHKQTLQCSECIKYLTTERSVQCEKTFRMICVEV